MGEYASKGVAGTGLGLGIGALSLGLLNSGCNGNGILSGLIGGCGCNNRGWGAELQYVSELQSKVERLEAEKYSDKVARETYQQTLIDNRNLRDELYAFIKPIAEEAVNNRVTIATLAAEQKCCCEKQALQAEITAGKINEATLALNSKIDVLSATNTGAFNSLNQTISCINGEIAGLTKRLNNITRESVPLCAVCPQPMQRFNSFTTPTAQAPDCGTCSVTSTAAASAAA